MKRSLLVGMAIAFAGLLYWATGKIARADATLSVPTAVASVSKLRVDSVLINFNTQTATVSFSFTDNNGTERGGGSKEIAIPQPTPAAIGNIMQAVTKSLCGYGSGSLGAITPVAVGTVVP